MSSYKKPSSKKGFIDDISVSDIIKNDLVGQKDYYIHTLSIKDDNDNYQKFEMRQMLQTPKLPIGTYVSFRHYKSNEFKNDIIEAKSFGKAFTQEEIALINKVSIAPKQSVNTANNRSRRSFN